MKERNVIVITNETPLSKDLLAPATITSKELKELVAEYLENGGVITQCEPGVALNFRTILGENGSSGRLKRPAKVRQLSKDKKKKKTA